MWGEWRMGPAIKGLKVIIAGTYSRTWAGNHSGRGWAGGVLEFVEPRARSRSGTWGRGLPMCACSPSQCPKVSVTYFTVVLPTLVSRNRL